MVTFVAPSLAAAFLGVLAYAAFVRWLTARQTAWNDMALVVVGFRKDVAELTALVHSIDSTATVAEVAARVGRLELSRGVGGVRVQG